MLVPDLRHVLVTASAIATLEHLAPGRAQVAIGTGFTGKMALGQRPLTWAFVEKYVRTLRAALLHGEEVEVDGALVKMLHPAGIAPDRPIETPLIVAAGGPKGTGIAREIGDGIMCIIAPQDGFDSCTLLTFGTVLDDGEALDSGPRPRRRRPRRRGGVPRDLRGRSPTRWRRSRVARLRTPTIEEVPEAQRHRADARGTFGRRLNARDRATLEPSTIPMFTCTGTADDVHAGVRDGRHGHDRDPVHAHGPDLERELRAFRDAVN